MWVRRTEALAHCRTESLSYIKGPADPFIPSETMLMKRSMEQITEIEFSPEGNIHQQIEDIQTNIAQGEFNIKFHILPFLSDYNERTLSSYLVNKQVTLVIHHLANRSRESIH